MINIIFFFSCHVQNGKIQIYKALIVYIKWGANPSRLKQIKRGSLSPSLRVSLKTSLSSFQLMRASLHVSAKSVVVVVVSFFVVCGLLARTHIKAALSSKNDIPTLQFGLWQLQTSISPYTVHFSSLLTFDSSEYGLYVCENYCPLLVSNCRRIDSQHLTVRSLYP